MALYTEICSCDVKEDYGDSFVYRYYLIEGIKRLSLSHTSMDLVCYGIKVVKEKRVDEGLIYVEEDLIDDISPNMDKVTDLISFLCKNNVSPVHLLDIISEIVDEWSRDFDTAFKKAVGC